MGCWTHLRYNQVPCTCPQFVFTCVNPLKNLCRAIWSKNMLFSWSQSFFGTPCIKLNNHSILGSKDIQKVTNHPVHIIDQDGVFYPTALIPFCEFGRSMSVMGVKSDQFDHPVCNSFRPKVIRDQLCYTVDPNKGVVRKYFY